MPGIDSKAAVSEPQVLFFIMPDDGRRFLVFDSSCDDPECPAVHLSLVEVDAENRRVEDARPIHASLDADTWRELPSENHSPAERRLVEAFLADLDDEGRAYLRKRFDADKEEARRLMSFVIPHEEIRSGALVSFTDIATGGQSVYSGGNVSGLSFDHKGTTYIIEDLYCPNPKCDCKKATLCFSRLQKKSEGSVLENWFIATWYFSGYSRVNEVTGCTKRVAREILSAWRKRDPGLAGVIRHRYQKIKEIGKRSLADAHGRPVAAQDLAGSPRGSRRKVGRNAPCLCGSGLKYKRCCGRNG